jgi:hypothetical protein
LIDAMSPMVVPTRSQTVAHARYSNITRAVGASVDCAATRPGSRIEVLIAERPIVIALTRVLTGACRAEDVLSEGSSALASIHIAVLPKRPSDISATSILAGSPRRRVTCRGRANHVRAYRPSVTRVASGGSA